MSKTTAEIQAEIDSKIIPNTSGEITAAIMHGILTDINQNKLNGVTLQGVNIALTTSPTSVVFAVAMPSADYALMIRTIGSIDYAITNKTANGFDIQGATSGQFDYSATLNI